MNLQTVEIPRTAAREQAAEYRRAAKTITDPERRREFDEIARAYRIAARDEVPMMPIVPPRHRPAAATTLASYLVLWEVDEWTWASPPLPPGDPALLRHVGGDIYAVLATWDLTELERLVLSGRRPE